MNNEKFRIIVFAILFFAFIIASFAHNFIVAIVGSMLVYSLYVWFVEKYRFVKEANREATTTGTVELLACDCDDCTHWEIVKTSDGRIHLHCKTCERRDEVTLSISGNQPAKWVKSNEE